MQIMVKQTMDLKITKNPYASWDTVMIANGRSKVIVLITKI